MIYEKTLLGNIRNLRTIRHIKTIVRLRNDRATLLPTLPTRRKRKVDRTRGIFDKPTMQSLSCAYTDRAHDWVREEARCIMRRFAVQRERESLDRGKAVCVLRSTSGKLLRACFFSSLVRLCHSFPLAPVPIELLADSFRLLWPIVQKTDRGSAVSFSHLVAFISRRDPLHNVHLCRPAERYRDRK